MRYVINRDQTQEFTPASLSLLTVETGQGRLLVGEFEQTLAATGLREAVLASGDTVSLLSESSPMIVTVGAYGSES